MAGGGWWVVVPTAHRPLGTTHNLQPTDRFVQSAGTTAASSSTAETRPNTRPSQPWNESMYV